jgi:Xaa-Pro aminopeptidase
MYNIYGQSGKDWEEGINFERLRGERLHRTKEAMEHQGLNALVAFTLENNRYITGMRGLPARGNMMQYTVVPAEGDPVHFAMGADLLRLNKTVPWLKGRLRPAIPVAPGPDMFGEEKKARSLALWAESLKKTLKEMGVSTGKVGFDSFDINMIEPLRNANIDYVDGRMAIYEARYVKTHDELQLLKFASTIADAAFYRIDEIVRPGIRECEIWGEVNKTILSLGAEYVLGHCNSGGRTNPFYRTDASDRILAPGDLLIVDIVLCYMGYHTCVIRTFLAGNKPSSEQKAQYRECYESLQKVLSACKAGATADQVAAALPQASYEDLGRHAVHGVGLWVHEMPAIINTPEYADKSIALKTNNYLAAEVHSSISEGTQAVRLEENYAITEKGYELFSKYPFDERFL